VHVRYLLSREPCQRLARRRQLRIQAGALLLARPAVRLGQRRLYVPRGALQLLGHVGAQALHLRLQLLHQGLRDI